MILVHKNVHPMLDILKSLKFTDNPTCRYDTCSKTYKMRFEIAKGTLWNAKSIKLSSPIVQFYVEGDEHPGCVKRISHYLSTHRLF